MQEFKITASYDIKPPEGYEFTGVAARVKMKDVPVGAYYAVSLHSGNNGVYKKEDLLEYRNDSLVYVLEVKKLPEWEPVDWSSLLPRILKRGVVIRVDESDCYLLCSMHVTGRVVLVVYDWLLSENKTYGLSYHKEYDSIPKIEVLVNENL